MSDSPDEPPRRARRWVVGVSAIAAAGLAVAAGFGVAPTGAALLIGLGASRLRRAPPEVRARALAARAVDRVPAEDGVVALVGTVRACADPLAAPYSHRRCVAVWTRQVARYGPDPINSYIAANHTATTEFILDCGGTQLVIAATGADVVYDPGHAEIVDHNGRVRPIRRDDAFEARLHERIVDIGDRVVVSGVLVHGNAEAGPYRGSGAPIIRLESRRFTRLVVSLRPPAG